MDVDVGRQVEVADGGCGRSRGVARLSNAGATPFSLVLERA